METNIKASGPWVLIDPEPPPTQSKGGIYLPDGNVMERLGHVVGRVISAGKGYWEKDKKGKEKFQAMEVKPGDRVVFRGHLKDANRTGEGKLCFMHMRDLILVLEEGVELNLALPYDN
jgi:co-chaperonin GroES (HSP10)